MNTWIDRWLSKINNSGKQMSNDDHHKNK
jgi:hypothetical protein